MAAIINTNIQSLNAQRSLSSSQSQLATSMQRLSSGMRINSAKDDAAGLAIAERMTTQVRGLTVAMRNANDGISLAQTAEGALGSVGSNLQRIRELAVQSRNATNSEEDRAALDAEVQQLKAEISRISRDTSFNGTKLLDGSFTNMAFQVGANQGQTIDISGIANASIDKLGEWTSVPLPTAPVTGVAPAGTAGVFAAASFSLNGEVINVSGSATTTAAQRMTDLVKAVNLQSHVTGVTASNDGGKLKLTATGGSGDIKIATSGTTDATALLAETGLAEGDNLATPGTPQTGFENLSVSTPENSDNAIVAMDAALRAINGARADLGAIQSRFETTVENLSVNTENLSASRSRIMDADFAAETANLSRTQILQQAGTAMVAQANQLPQQVLKLLQG
ncbi:flagellin [Comamonas thiooxydans]|uniref:flagellin N-terminal helical domain-containing protein n=1 Tax=Comamonas thiooxydans TaxID=363952 RepID=UPI0007C55CA1|nr:flagellin [Comamonas thiooxydans]MDH1476472.1 flagellin [Comamonas thiooxydans]OAD82225.1 flagellin [Comamonas thiooxydans]